MLQRIKQIIIIIFITLSYYNCISQSLNQGSVDANYYTEIPYEWINEKIILPVEIEGETYRFLLDTGAPNMITESLEEKITTKYLRTIPVKDATGQSDSLEMVSLPKLKLGNVIFKNTPTMVMKNNPGSALIFDCFKIDGIVGSNMFRNSIVQILPKQQLVKLTDNRKKLSLNKKISTKMKADNLQSRPYIYIKLKSLKKMNEKVLVDTGMKGFYNMSQQHYDYFKGKEAIQTVAKGKGSLGGGLYGIENQTNYFKVNLNQITIGQAKFTNFITTTTQSKNPRLGNSLLKYGSITFDFKNKRFYYESFQKQDVDLSEKHFGFNVTAKDGKLIVGVIWDKNLENRLSYGDQILSINNDDYRNPDLCKLVAEKSISERYDKMDLVILKANGEEIKLQVKKQHYSANK